MGWFNPATELSDIAREALESLANSGSSEAAGVADCLNTIAENGEEQAEDAFLMCCAEEMIAAAQSFIDTVKPSLFDALMAYTLKEKKIEQEAVIITSTEGGGGKKRQTLFLQGTPLWTNFQERAFVFANEEDAQWFIDHYPESLADANVYLRHKP